MDFDSDAMDVDDDHVENFFPGHFPLPGDGYHRRTLDAEIIEQQLVPDITLGIAAIDLDPFDHREPVVIHYTAPPTFNFPNDTNLTAYQTPNATTVATLQTANTTANQRNAFTQEIPQQNVAILPGAWTGRAGLQGVGDSQGQSAGASSTTGFNAFASRAVAFDNVFANAETGQTASMTPGGSARSTVQVQTGLQVHGNVSQQPAFGQSSAQAVLLPVTTGNDAFSSNGFNGAIADGGDLAPVTLLQGSTDTPRGPQWTVLVWPRSVITQAARLMASTEGRIRQTALQLMTATAQARGIAIGETRAAEAFEAAKAEIAVASWSEGYVVGQRDARDGEETAIAEAFAEGRTREREVLEQAMTRRDTESFNRGVEMTQRAVQADSEQRQSTIAGLEDRLIRATQNSTSAQRHAETLIERQRVRIQQLENDVTAANVQAEQRRSERAREGEQVRAQRELAEQQRLQQVQEIQRVQAELVQVRQRFDSQEQLIDQLRRDASNARSTSTEQSNRNETLERERASLDVQITALREERDGFAAELARERAERQVAPQAAPARMQLPDQDANMDQADEQGPPAANAAGILDDATLQEALTYQGDVFDRNRAQIIQSMHITVRQVLGQGGGVLENEDFFVLGQRPEWVHPIIGADRIRSLITDIGIERVREAVSEVGFQDYVLAQLMGGARVAPAVARPQHVLPTIRHGGGEVSQSRIASSTAVPGAFYDDMENGAGPPQNPVEELAPNAPGTTLLDQSVNFTPITNSPVPPPTATSTAGFAFDTAKFLSLVAEATAIHATAATRQRRQRLQPPTRDSAAFDMSSLTTGLLNSTEYNAPPRERSASPLQEITAEESAWANAPIPVPTPAPAPAPLLNLVHRGPAQGRQARQQNRTRGVLDNGLGSSRHLSRRDERRQ